MTEAQDAKSSSENGIIFSTTCEYILERDLSFVQSAIAHKSSLNGLTSINISTLTEKTEISYAHSA